MRVAALVAICLLLAGCNDDGPLLVTRGQDACARCRMVIVSTATAAQIVSPGEEPQFFDELGCLRDYLAALPEPLPAEAVAYVADHRTGEWIEATRAIFTRSTVSTPMASGILAHADAGSRDADPLARGGAVLASDEVLRPARSRGPS